MIPNLDNDMHDGTVAQGDTWLQTHLGDYVTWAKTHNSLFILTFDEDDNGSANQIPTIVAGERVTPGSYSEHINHYNVLRTLQDAFGLAPLANSAAATPILDVWTAGDGNQSPSAAFTSTCTALACSFDGSGSSDSDGNVVSYAWSFGDGATSTLAEPDHTFAVGGTFPVTLTVTDDGGATNSVLHQVTVTAPGSPPFASDGFARTVASGWGSADVGGTWTTTSSTAFSVAPGSGTIRHATSGSQVSASLAKVSSADTDLTLGFSLDKSPAGYYLTAVGRRISSGNEYEARVLVNANNSVSMWLAKAVASTQTTIVTARTVPGLTFVPGTPLRLRMQVTGTAPTTIRAKVWASTAAEPSTWFDTTTDTTAALQNPGSIALTSYLSSAVTNAPVTARFTDLAARPTAAAPNQPPSAVFTPTCTNLACSFDGSGSSDPEGHLASYAWNFGDGATSTLAQPTHTFATSDTYQVTLTVTDDQSATNAVTHPVTVTGPPPPPNQPPTAVFTPTCTNLACSFDGSGSSDPEGHLASYAWNFGDGATSTLAQPTHTFATSDTYQVTLTVTDDQSATNAVTHPVTVTAPANQPFASDGFARTVASGWGSADTGGAWSTTSSTAFSVTPGAGLIRHATSGSQVSASLAKVSSADTDLTLGFGVDKATTYYLTATGRRVSSGNEYAARVLLNPNNTVNLWLTKTLAGTQSTILTARTVPGLTYAPGTTLRMRVQVTGSTPTTIRAKVWPATGTEPTTWFASTTDTTPALQNPGSLALTSYLSSAATNAPVTARFTDLTARHTG